MKDMGSTPISSTNFKLKNKYYIYENRKKI